MSALAAQGDRAGALAHARKHEELVRRELDSGADAEVVELAKRLRREKPAASAIPSDISAERPTASSPKQTAVPVVSARSPWRWALFGIAVAGLAVLLALVALPRGSAGPPMLAVGQMRDAAARDSASSTGVLTDMLATNLGRVRGLQVVANSRLFELMRPGFDTTRGAFSEAARRAGGMK